MRKSEDFDAFYAARAQGLVRSIYFRTGDLGRAQDCVQEAFVRAWMKWPKLRAEAPTAWVRAVAWHLAVSDWRATRDRLRVRLSPQVEPSENPPPVEVIVTVRQALTKLPEIQQTVVVLHYFECMSVADISGMIDMPTGTVKSHLHRARRVLRVLLSDDADIDEPTRAVIRNRRNDR